MILIPMIRSPSFHIVQVDEGQDLSLIMPDALEHCRKRIIIVGHTHQQINSFRCAIAAMKRFPFDDGRDLIMSFRFDRDIAEIAWLLIQESKDEKSPHANRKRASRPGLPGTRYGKFTIEADLPKPPRKKPFKVGDRVRTSHGTGTVAETDGEKYLVALDGQSARLWEKEWDLKKA